MKTEVAVQSQLRAPDVGQYVVVVVVAYIERQVAMDAFQRAGSVQAARTAGAYCVIDGVQRQVLDGVAGAGAGQPRGLFITLFP